MSTERIYQVNVYELTGSLIKQFRYPTGGTAVNLDLSGLSNGTCVLQIYGNYNWYSQQVVMLYIGALLFLVFCCTLMKLSIMPMRMKFASTVLLMGICIWTVPACHKSNSPTNALPPETYAGLNTMGCLVNGELFIPQQNGGFMAEPFSTALVNGGPGFNLGFIWSDEWAQSKYNIINIGLDSVALTAGTTYTLGAQGPPDTGRVWPYAINAIYHTLGGPSMDDFYYTSSQVTGQITIDYYNESRRIVAGRFAFDAVDNNGDTVKVRQGRFDMYIQLP